MIKLYFWVCYVLDMCNQCETSGDNQFTKAMIYMFFLE